jgi:hypothetical protein
MAKIIDFFDGAESSTEPVVGDIEASNLTRHASDAAYEAVNTGSPIGKNIYYNTTLDVIRYYDDAAAAWQSLVNQDQLDLKIDLSEKGAPNGVAELDGTGKVPAAQLPSYVDDVEEYANLAAFPVSGETGKIYVALNTNKTYRWTGSIYVEISASDVNSVNGATGAVTVNAINELTGDVTAGPASGSQSQAATIANDAVSNAKLANMATQTIKGRTTAGSGDPEDLTSAQATAILDVFTSTDKGLVPASGGGTTNFLRADGTFAVPPGSGGSIPEYQSFGNLGLSASASAGALTINLKQADGTTDPGAANDAVVVYFRDSTITSGAVVRREVTSALSLVIPSGATLGINATTPDFPPTIAVYLIDDGGTVRLAVRTKAYYSSDRENVVAIDTSADNSDQVFASAASSDSAIIFIGLLQFTESGLNGTWTNPTRIYVGETAKSILNGNSILDTLTMTTITSGTSGNWVAASTNLMRIPPGVWLIYGQVDFNNSGTTPNYSVCAAKWASANGANNTTEPSGIGTISPNISFPQFTYGASAPRMSILLPETRVNVDSTSNFYLVPRISATTMANISVTATAYFRRIG